MLSSSDRTILYDPNKFKGVSPQTRIAIIGVIDLDMDGLAQQEGGKFTYEELCHGLHYLLPKKEELQVYFDKNESGFSSCDFEENACGCLFLYVFVVFLAVIFTELLIGYVLLFLLVVFCINIGDMLESEESKLVKIAKIVTSLIVFIGVTVLAWFFLPAAFYKLSGVLLAFLIGGLATALFSFVSKKILFLYKENPDELLKPADELLVELENVKTMLSKNYAKKDDNKQACMEFVKTVVKYHIKSISKPENEANNISVDSEVSSNSGGNTELPVQASSSLGGHGSFYKSVITTQPANDANKPIEEKPTCSASK